MDVDRGLAMLSTGRSEAVRRYRRLMREEETEPYDRVRSVGQLVAGLVLIYDVLEPGEMVGRVEFL